MPVNWKVKAAIKKGLKTDSSNYRQISLLLLLSKVDEIFAMDQKNDFDILTTNTLIINVPVVWIKLL